MLLVNKLSICNDLKKINENLWPSFSNGAILCFLQAIAEILKENLLKLRMNFTIPTISIISGTTKAFVGSVIERKDFIWKNVLNLKLLISRELSKREKNLYNYSGERKVLNSLKFSEKHIKISGEENMGHF
ncbi:hypothetical protein BpHYR1_015623 [Brachionus plicatilis]|uniref:Uncharacterized protein n=1 Tax=Brachionus plicatilis TaxID=10195 RepID=A0A3M7RHH3_BRAPC|nr:hypothetical protein BpHYR1_015623 [Brachionus plicatilis]